MADRAVLAGQVRALRRRGGRARTKALPRLLHGHRLVTWPPGRLGTGVWSPPVGIELGLTVPAAEHPVRWSGSTAVASPGVA